MLMVYAEHNLFCNNHGKEVKEMYEFTKKTVEENVNAVILFSENSCKQGGICDAIDGVCSV